jgi:hypothetical protein
VVHYGRFNKVIKGINPITESFTPSFKETDLLRIYVLAGKEATLLWLRDKMNNWQTELEQGISPQALHSVKVNLTELDITSSSKNIDVYDPWKNVWTKVAAGNSLITLPDFKRSVIVRVTTK